MYRAKEFVIPAKKATDLAKKEIKIIEKNVVAILIPFQWLLIKPTV